MSPATELIQRQVASQPSDVTVTTTNENFFERMGNAFVSVIIGAIMMFFSVPILWLNEKRNAKYEALIDKGESDCISITANDFDEKNTHCLVHVTGTTSSTKPVKDEQFNVRYASGVIRLSSVVEIYQWREEEKSRSRTQENFGGGKTTTTEKWKEYTKQWNSYYDSGEGFEKPGHRNSKPVGIRAGSFAKTCERVEFGQGFLLGTTELDSLSGGSKAKISNLVCEGNTGLNFVADGDWYFYGKGNMASPQIGDVRVSFTVLSDGPATVVALQSQGTEKGRGSFMPYRVIRRSPCPCFPLSEDVVKERLFDEAQKKDEDINAEEMWGGAMACFCCACNIVQFCCGATVGVPRIQDTFGSTLSKSQAFRQIRTKASFLKWMCRAVGWLLMFIGLCLTFSPFTTFLKILPFGIGSFLSSVAGGIVFVFSFSVTLLAATIIVAMAYTMYHPIFGLMAFGIVAAIVAAILVICNVAHPK